MVLCFKDRERDKVTFLLMKMILACRLISLSEKQKTDSIAVTSKDTDMTSI